MADGARVSAAADEPAWSPIGPLAQLKERGLAMPFELRYAGRPARGFVVLVDGQPRGYLNQCTHVPMELDWQPNQVFDVTGRWLLCATHGAHYRPDTGACAGGPCRGGLVKIPLLVRDGVVGWCVAPPFDWP